MKSSKLAKSLLTYLPLLAVMAAVVIGVFIGKSLYPISVDSQRETPVLVLGDQNNLPLLAISGAARSCISPLIYTSLPPKCKTADGTFMQINGMPSNFIPLPKGK